MRPLIVAAGAAVLSGLLITVASFPFAPLAFRSYPVGSASSSSSTRSFHPAPISRSIVFYSAQDNKDEDVETNRKYFQLSRREALTNTGVATLSIAAAAVANPNPAAASTEPTRIELRVETDYLIKTLDYFDGDMRKVLSAIVRSPFTTVQIDPPSSRNDETSRDAILRALYSYEAPEDYVTQASWVKVEVDRRKQLVDFLTKKRYKIDINREEVGGTGTTISLSNLDAGVSAVALSYPLAYAYYEYESYREEQESKAKKAKMAAKKAAAAAKKNKEDTKTKDGPPKAKIVNKKEQSGVKDSSEDDSLAAQKEMKEQTTTKAAKKPERPTSADTMPTDSTDDKMGEELTPDMNASDESLTPSRPVDGPAGNGGDSPTVSSNVRKQTGMDAYAQQYAAMLAASQQNSSPPPPSTTVSAPTSPPTESVTPPESPKKSSASSSTGSYLDNL